MPLLCAASKAKSEFQASNHFVVPPKNNPQFKGSTAVNLRQKPFSTSIGLRWRSICCWPWHALGRIKPWHCRFVRLAVSSEKHTST